MQAQELTRPLDEGSILCLEDRTVLGRVEEVFGPVKAPLYALRYAGKGAIPQAVQAPAWVFSVEKYTEFVPPEALQPQTVSWLPLHRPRLFAD